MTAQPGHAAPAITPLRVRSGHSLLRGTAGPEAIVDRASRLGHTALALTDVNSLAGATEFHAAATAAGITPIIGAELLAGPQRIVALVTNEAGYGNLCQLITAIHADAQLELALAVAAKADGLELIADDPAMVEALFAAGLSDYRAAARGKIWVGVDPACHSRAELRRLIVSARCHSLPLLATAAALVTNSDDGDAARLLAAIRLRKTVDTVPRAAVPPAAAHLRPAADLARACADMPGALANNRALTEACSEFALLPRESVFPAYAPPDGLTPHAYLHQLCRRGAEWRYGGARPAGFDARLTRELALIERRSLAEYFLVVWDIVSYARRRGVPVAGRGSGASSLVAYLLGVTNVCPLTYDIPFERFLNDRRTDYPDLDVDFCWRVRDDVIDYAFKCWGADHVAMVCTHSTFQARSALRETAKAFGLSDEQLNHLGRSDDPRQRRIVALSRRILHLPHNLSVHPGGIVMSPGRIDRIAPLEMSAKGVRITQYDKRGVKAIGLVKIDLLGNRSLSTIRAACEIIRSRDGQEIDIDALPDDDPATLALLQSADTVGCNQLESPAMRYLLRGMRPAGIADVMKALALIRPGAAGTGMKDVFIRRHRRATAQERGVGILPAHPKDILPACPKGVLAVKTKSAGETPTPQRETPAPQRETLAPQRETLAPQDETPMPREGGRFNAEPPPTTDPRIAGVLADTYGVMLYEDDVMLLAAAMLGSSPGEGDRFRKGVQSCKSDAERLAISQEFIDRCMRRGFDRRTVEDIWVQMAKFNAYSFCRAHAGSYGRLAWVVAYLKTHHPLAFWAGALNNNQSMYHPRVYVEQAKRMGIRFLGPDVSRSDCEFAVEGDAIRLGLNCVGGLGPAGVQKIIDARSGGEFATLGELLRRTALGDDEMRSLILCGACDSFGRSRPALMMELALARDSRPAAPDSRTVLLAGEVALPHQPDDYTPQRKYADERRITGLSAGEHVMAVYRPTIADSVTIDSRQMGDCVGKPVRIAGVLEAVRTTATRSGGKVTFLTLDDEFGLFEGVYFHGKTGRGRRGARENRLSFSRYGPYVLAGRVQDQYGTLTVAADSVELRVPARPVRAALSDSQECGGSGDPPHNRNRPDAPRRKCRDDAMSDSIADKFIIGTSGYSFADWVGPFYPPGTRSGEMLGEYAKHFSTVELNFSYYRMPTAKTLAGIAGRTPADFAFWIKANQETTHKANRDAAEPFLAAIEPLSEAGKLAGVLMQFPQSFHRTADNRQYLAQTLADFASVPVAVEFRHNSWQAEQTLAGLRERNVTLVIPDAPDIRSLYHHPPVATSNVGYLRLHSRNADKWYAGPVERYDYHYSEAELADLAGEWTPIAEIVDKVYVYFNNCHGGQAADNAESFRRLLAQMA